MAIVFTKKKRRQNNLVFIFVLILLVIIIVLWQGFSRKDISILPDRTIVVPPREVIINFQVLEKTQKFETFTEIKPLEETFVEEEAVYRRIGRENPFLRY